MRSLFIIMACFSYKTLIFSTAVFCLSVLPPASAAGPDAASANQDLSEIAKAPGGVGLERSRIVIRSGAKEASIGVRSLQPSDILVSASVEDSSFRPTDVFVVSPAVYRLKPMSENRLRLTQTKPLPNDRESVFYVTINCIPSIPAGETNRMVAVISQRIKLFYRPKGLFGDSGYAASELKWSFKGNKLTAYNPTKLSVSAAWISFGTDELNIRNLILPGESATWEISEKNLSLRTFKFTYINEYGASNTYEVRLSPS